jgi:peptidyl-prolyl cis-trans isomerase A (cyclophilin A)
MKTGTRLSIIFLISLSIFSGPASKAQQQAEDHGDGDAPRPNGPYVVIDTTMGRITCQFYQKQAPKTVENFIGLAEGTKAWLDPVTQSKVMHKRYFDGSKFSRVVPEFMIQGGDRIGNGSGNPGYTFADEHDPTLNFDTPAKLAMANGGPNTNSGQFFITETDYDTLNQKYTIFGQCDVPSLEVIKAIARVPRDKNDKPLKPVVIKKVTIVRDGEQIPPLPNDQTAAATPVTSETKK